MLAAIKADGLLSDEHFTVDGTLLEAWASHKSFKPKGGSDRPPDNPKNPTVNFRGQTRRNDTHRSTTDPDARLYKKAVGREAKLGYLAHLLTENRHGLIIDTAVTAAGGTAERDAAVVMLGELPLTTRRLTVAADKAYGTRAWVAAVRRMHITPHVAQNEFGYGGTAIDARTTRHVGYRLSHRKRKLIEQAFGWLKTVALFRKLRHRGDSWSIGCLASAPPPTTLYAGAILWHSARDAEDDTCLPLIAVTAARPTTKESGAEPSFFSTLLEYLSRRQLTRSWNRWRYLAP